MSGDEVNKLQLSPVEQEKETTASSAVETQQSLFADAYNLNQSKSSETTLGSVTEWVGENPGKASALGLVALAGLAYVTRGKWMPIMKAVAPFSDDAARAVSTRGAGYDAAKNGLTRFAEVANPGLQPWKSSLGYVDVGLDQAGTLIYRGSRAGVFAAESRLVVSGADEASTLYRAISREGLIERKVWQTGASNAASHLGEVQLPGTTRFIFDGKAIDLPAKSKLINLGNGKFDALTAEAAEKLYKGLSIY